MVRHHNAKPHNFRRETVKLKKNNVRPRHYRTKIKAFLV